MSKYMSPLVRHTLTRHQRCRNNLGSGNSFGRRQVPVDNLNGNLVSSSMHLLQGLQLPPSGAEPLVIFVYYLVSATHLLTTRQNGNGNGNQGLNG